MSSPRAPRRAWIRLVVLMLGTCAMPVLTWADEPPRTILVRGERLAEAKRRLSAGDRDLQPALDALLVRAREALNTESLSVMQKQIVPPSGDKHDYMSLAPYWWPNPATSNGLPYVRRDGEFNPQSRTDHDGLRMQRTIAAAKTLAYAWYFTRDDTFARGAATRLRVFFLDPATRMNPHLSYGQAILGVTEGRGAGMIDTRMLPDLVDTVRVLAGASSWTSADNDGMVAWCRAFLKWMQDSPQGREERDATNNHGVFYDAQKGALALFVGDEAAAREALDTSAKRRISRQIARDGSQPEELARTRPLHYSVFTLDAFTMVAEMARHVNVDLWAYTPARGGTLTQALRYVAPYAADPRTFPKKDVTPFDQDVFLPALSRAAAVLKEEDIVRAFEALPADLRRTRLSAFEVVAPDAR